MPSPSVRACCTLKPACMYIAKADVWSASAPGAAVGILLIFFVCFHVASYVAMTRLRW